MKPLHLMGWIGVTALLSSLLFTDSSAQYLNKPDSTYTFTVQTYDGLTLPAQVMNPENVEKPMILFINGSTPYDEKGNMGPVWNDEGKILTMKHDLSHRFFEVMASKGYPIATMAKRSFVYPTKIPRPAFIDLALDIQYFIEHLKSAGLLKDEASLVIVGYSEGSVVASKVLGILKNQPHACILMGAASMATGTDCHAPSLEDYVKTDLLRNLRNFNDEQIKADLDQICRMQHVLLNMDEEEFESDLKHSRDPGFGFAMWESFYIDRKAGLYDPVPNLLYANIPLLIVIGDKDTSMPMKSSKQTYDRLLARGFEKATFHVIEDDVHQYTRYDLFPVIDKWLTSEFQSTDFILQKSDSLIMQKYAEIQELVSEIRAIPFEGGTSVEALAVYEKATERNFNEADNWFTLGVKLFANSLNQEAFNSFVNASDSTLGIYFASLVWRGHLKDLEGQRAEAVNLYQQALHVYPGFPIQHGHWNLIIDKNWIEERIKVPFQGVP